MPQMHLVFKYIFDYAERMHQPCVINFSEGSSQDFHGYDQLYYELLAKLIGPGRIIVLLLVTMAQGIRIYIRI